MEDKKYKKALVWVNSRHDPLFSKYETGELIELLGNNALETDRGEDFDEVKFTQGSAVFIRQRSSGTLIN